MSILVNKDSKVIVQGITGSEGSFHAKQCLEYGTQIVGGVTPGKGGIKTLDGAVDVYNSVELAKKATGANVSLIFVPPAFAAGAIIEAIESEIEVVVCITEGIPIRDMIMVQSRLRASKTRLIGPNCPGLLTPGEAKVGIMPGFIAKPGNVGVISKSGTLTYEAVDQLTKKGLGQSTCIGIGGDPIIGSSMIDLLKLFEKDEQTRAVVLIGEIGGGMEIEASHFVKNDFSKPVFGFVAGQTAPKGRRMGHAGAVISGADESAEAKKNIMAKSGIHVVDSPADIGDAVYSVLNK